jgi:hypothetical protein
MQRQFLMGLVVLAFLAGAGSLQAQANPNYVLTIIAPASANLGATFNSDAELDTLAGAGPVSGWSFGVCNDLNVLLCTAVDDADTATVNGGAAPGFQSLVIQTGGYTQGVVINLFGQNPLPAGTTDFTMVTATYEVDAAAPTGLTNLTFCSTLGVPPVATVVVVGGASITPVQNGDSVDIQAGPQLGFEYIAPNESVGYNPASGTFNFTTSVTIDQIDNGTPDALTQGFSMGLAHDPAQLNVTNADSSLPFVPAFESPALLANGWTVGIVYTLVPPVQTLVLQDFDVMSVAYENAAGAPLLGNMTGVTTPLTWSNGLGAPPVANVVVVGGASFNAVFVDGSVALNPVTTVEFRRADSNFDGIVNIADGIWILNDLFQGGPTTTGAGGCDGANDANGNGLIDAGDATFIFMHQFMNGPQPPAPFPDCGTFPGQQPAPADCDSYPAC